MKKIKKSTTNKFITVILPDGKTKKYPVLDTGYISDRTWLKLCYEDRIKNKYKYIHSENVGKTIKSLKKQLDI